MSFKYSSVNGDSGCSKTTFGEISACSSSPGPMASQPPVVAAIPNYNMAASLRELLPQVLAQSYDRVFVLDDASTDDTVDVVDSFGGDVTLVRSPQNRGAGANRNQIIDHVADGTIIHFIDADMDLATTETPTPRSA